MESWFLKVLKVPEAGWGPQGGLALPSYPSTPPALCPFPSVVPMVLQLAVSLSRETALFSGSMLPKALSKQAVFGTGEADPLLQGWRPPLGSDQPEKALFLRWHEGFP